MTNPTPHLDRFIALADQLKTASEAVNPQEECRELLRQLTSEVELIEPED